MASFSKGKKMKTLDEVISTMKYEATYNSGEARDYDADALYYLKDMKNLAEDYDILYNKYWREYNQQQANPALTWDELRTMEGKPIWIEFLNDEGEWNGEWCLVESSNNILCEILRCKMSWWGLRTITLGKTWKAYRKEIM